MRIACVLMLAILAAVVSPHDASAQRPLETAVAGVFDPTERIAYERIRGAGAAAYYTPVPWRSVAPANRPVGFDATNPFDPAYNWKSYDDRLRTAISLGLRPVVMIHGAPQWAEGAGGGPPGTNTPDPVEFGKFARAAAARYSGAHPGLPRVRFWQAWGEPNIGVNLNPQQTPDGRAFAFSHYRKMLNQFAAGVRSVRGDNVVLAAGLAPFGFGTSSSPLRFMRSLLCVTKRLKPLCRTRVSFDIWSNHPFTSGGPTHSANHPDDVSLADLPNVSRVLRAAIRLGHVDARRPVRFWVTEFSWDTKPPDPQGVPLQLHRRWVAEALYRMWKAGVSFVGWTQLRDEPLHSSYMQSGLYFRGATLARDRPKPSLQAFRFPLVAFPQRGRVYVWGRTPHGRSGRVLVEHRVGRNWKRLGVVSANRYGIFERRFSAPTRGWVRARSLRTGARAAPFSLAHVPDRFFNPFGSTSFESKN